MARILCLRHGNTGKAKSDYDRQLTELGKTQAKHRADHLQLKKLELIISSTAPRAIETATIIVGDNLSIERVWIPALYEPGYDADKRAIEELSRKLEYSSLRKYLKHDQTGAINRWIDHAFNQIMQVLERRWPDDVLIVGHAVMINGIAEKFCTTQVQRDLCLDTCLGECEGILIGTDMSAEHIRD